MFGEIDVVLVLGAGGVTQVLAMTVSSDLQTGFCFITTVGPIWIRFESCLLQLYEKIPFWLLHPGNCIAASREERRGERAELNLTCSSSITPNCPSFSVSWQDSPASSCPPQRAQREREPIKIWLENFSAGGRMWVSSLTSVRITKLTPALLHHFAGE